MPTLLWDIDGTLVRTGGAGKAAMEEALRGTFGVRRVKDEVPYSGRTDRAIGRDLLRVHDLPHDVADVNRLTDAYLELLPAMLAEHPGAPCPGILTLLERLQGVPHVRMGLLTGNVRRGAERKLRHFGLWDYFAFGGFGDHSPDRNAVAEAAVTAAAVDPRTSPVWVIGDTPHDVSCGKHVGAKTLAVATGWHPLSELAACGADLTLDDLSRIDTLPAEWFAP